MEWEVCEGIKSSELERAMIADKKYYLVFVTLKIEAMTKCIFLTLLTCSLAKVLLAQADWEKYEPWKGTGDYNPVGTFALSIDAFDNKWMTCNMVDSFNIAKFDGSTWTYYSIPGAVAYWDITSDKVGNVYAT